MPDLARDIFLVLNGMFLACSNVEFTLVSFDLYSVMPDLASTLLFEISIFFDRWDHSLRNWYVLSLILILL